MRGSIYVAIGPWAPPRIHRLTTGGWRVCLGIISICAIPQDIEALLAKASRALARRS